ncbi:DNA adenine methylase [Mergibacter septicus]|uniref:Dam family site-specific DNA-(adenine-N6)-methyltransferase n=1 Tax=Mergibacter septicus TaxID=221402 RepID=UPI001179789F|nr:Dam family site-specific DNA-(adenine-N6)-methyltransferase [Mergibacter septicus]AWX13326.1 DNA adenine methylase [Mergibacter septicus]
MSPRAVSKKSIKKHRSFLKWAGGKFRLIDEIIRLLPKKKKGCLIEPFVGAGSVFLNTDFEHYILADINPDLINLFNIIKLHSEDYIEESKKLFQHPQANSRQYYYDLRTEFNDTDNLFRKAIIFLYLNRFGFNGLCRYNSNNQFNVPFGSYQRHYFPEKELYFFAEKAQKAEFICASFEKTLELADEHTVVYCDPPYAPLIQDTNFTSYAGNEFGLEQQQHLAELARKIAIQNASTVLISNHDTPFTRSLYVGAKLRKIKVQRSISHNAKQRVKVNELIAIFNQNKR